MNSENASFGATHRERTVAGSCALTREAVEELAERLRSWALIRGATITGPAFLRLRADGSADVHLPVAGDVAPHPDLGFRLHLTGGGPALLIQNVAFGDIADTVHRCISHVFGQVSAVYGEFRPAERSFMTGTVAIPRSRARVDLLGDPERPGNDLPATTR